MPRANLKPDAIIRAAADAADRDGFDSITLTAVARQLGVQTASLYAHVKDRAAVLDGVRELALDEVSGAIEVQVAGRSGRDALVGLAEAQRVYGRDHPGRWAALLHPFSSSISTSRAEARLRTLGLAALRGYDIPEGELVHASRMLDSTINGFVELERTGMLRRRADDPEASWSRILNCLDAILRTWRDSAMTEDTAR
ncbi:transcriptional regulator [Frondihabitans sucicola]|uniref:Transcriptional regulator n=1 Tax=Frondihabitans sucicola TaxID=1268041 RepID=A0ABM8GKF8_9MICO|nr:TetR/AcrR family transcriptional regulator [Frondihabitans sucicola]BDZ48875.1 transcriptional regulator [Frondihabitans sucicola]